MSSFKFFGVVFGWCCFDPERVCLDVDEPASGAKGVGCVDDAAGFPVSCFCFGVEALIDFGDDGEGSGLEVVAPDARVRASARVEVVGADGVFLDHEASRAGVEVVGVVQGGGAVVACCVGVDQDFEAVDSARVDGAEGHFEDFAVRVGAFGGAGATFESPGGGIGDGARFAGVGDVDDVRVVFVVGDVFGANELKDVVGVGPVFECVLIAEGDVARDGDEAPTDVCANAEVAVVVDAGVIAEEGVELAFVVEHVLG